MQKFAAAAFAAAGLVFSVSAGNAASFVTYLASGGATTSCGETRSAPCSSLTPAVQSTNDGGEVHCLDSGPFVANGVISKSVTINCPGATFDVIALQLAGSLESQIVKFNGVTLSKSTTNANGAALFIRGGHVILENSTVKNATNLGIEIMPNGSPTRVSLINTIVTNNAAGNIRVRGSTFPTWLTLDRVTMTNSIYGVRAEGNGAGKISVEAHASVAAHNTNNGFLAVSNAGQGPVRFKITRSVAHNNGAYGAVATGPQATMIVSESSLTENGTGLAQLSDATVATYSNNDVNLNTTNKTGTIMVLARQ